jgi:hypothetical protein
MTQSRFGDIEKEDDSATGAEVHVKDVNDIKNAGEGQPV